MPINYHHNSILPSEVNKPHHLAEATLLYQFYMSNTHYPTTQSHSKENLFKSTYSHDSNSLPSEVNKLLHLEEAATQSDSQEVTTQKHPADYHNERETFDSLLHSCFPRRSQLLNSESWANSQEVNPSTHCKIVPHAMSLV